MPIGYTALPAFRDPGGFDFSGLNEGLDVLGKTLERNRLLAQKQEIGKALQSGSGSQTSSSSPQYAPEPQQNKLLGNSSPAQYGANSVVDRITGVESGGNANATNSRSSATGLGQFTSGTWLDTIKKSRPDIASGKSDAELLSLRTDPNLSREMTGAYADSNGRMLQGAGYEASPGNTYLAHFAGPGGAKSVLGANPATPLTQILTPEAIRANPHIANMTAGDLRAWADRKMGGARPSAPSVSTSAPQGLNYQAGANKALSQGDLSTGLSLLDAQRENENTAYTRARQTRLDDRSEANDALTREGTQLTIQGAREKLEQSAQARVASIAQTIESASDPAQRQVLWNKFVGANPKIGQTLQQYGIDPADHANGSAMLIAEARGLGTQDKTRYTASKQGVLDTWTGRITPPTPGSAVADAEYGTSPQYYTDKDGNVRVGQLSKAGGMKPVDLPEGAKILPGIDYKDTGTGYAGVEKRTGRVTGQVIPRDVAGKETQEVLGKDRGSAQVALPVVEQTTDRLLDRLTRLGNSPMRSSFTGYKGYLPNVSPEANDYQAILNEVQGNTFLTAFNNLRGGGAITEAEGAKATASLSRLQQTAPSDAGYQNAIDDARAVFTEIRDNVRHRAGVSGSAAQSGPPGGEVDRIKSKYGLE